VIVKAQRATVDDVCTVLHFLKCGNSFFRPVFEKAIEITMRLCKCKFVLDALRAAQPPPDFEGLLIFFSTEGSSIDEKRSDELCEGIFGIVQALANADYSNFIVAPLVRTSLDPAVPMPYEFTAAHRKKQRSTTPRRQNSSVLQMWLDNLRETVKAACFVAIAANKADRREQPLQ
jgi:hypothetical protein